MLKNRRVRFALVLPGLMLAGCSSSQDPGVAISGRVTYQGKPVEDGMIFLEPDISTPSRSGMARITRGRFQMPSDQAPGPGEFRVDVVAMEDQVLPGSLQKVKGIGTAIPEEYNKKSTMKVTIPKRKSYELIIDLK